MEFIGNLQAPYRFNYNDKDISWFCKFLIKSKILYMKCIFYFQDGRTVLHFAASFAKEDIVKLLLNRKADVTIPGGVNIYFIPTGSFSLMLVMLTCFSRASFKCRSPYSFSHIFTIQAANRRWSNYKESTVVSKHW